MLLASPSNPNVTIPNLNYLSMQIWVNFNLSIRAESVIEQARQVNSCLASLNAVFANCPGVCVVGFVTIGIQNRNEND